MTRSRWASIVLVAALGVALSSCSNSGTTYNPTPVMGQLFPDSVPANGLSATACTSASPMTLNVSGTGFITTTQAMWNGSNRTTTLNVNTNQLTVSLLACDLTTPGKGEVTLSNPGPGGGTSAGATFTILQPDNPVPAISSISPTSTPVGILPPGGVLTINAASSSSGFVEASLVAFNGVQRTGVTFVSSTQLTVPVTNADVAGNASINVTVSNPAPGGGVSAPVVFKVGAGGAAHTQFPLVVSMNAQGGGANGPSAAPAMSADGRYVAFYSQARNLVEKGASGNIFVRDTCLGANNCTPQTAAVDLAADGTAPNELAGEHIALSADGRYVAFVSSASNLVAGTASEAGRGGMPPDSHVFLRDLCLGTTAPAGCAPHTTIVSADTNGNAVHGLSPSISGDGRYVAFVSWDRSQPDGSAEGSPQIFVRDTCAGPSAPTGCVARTYHVPVDGQTNWAGDAKPTISSDGRFVAFERWSRQSLAANSPLQSRVVLRDTCLGEEAPAGCIPSTTAISISPGGAALGGMNMFPSVSGHGRFVAFVSRASATLGGLAAAQQLYFRDTCLGAAAPEICTPSTTMISSEAASSAGYPSAFSPWMSFTGRYVSFVAGASEDSNTNEAPRDGYLFVRDTCFGAGTDCSPRTYSVAAPGASAPAGALSVYKFTPVPLTEDGQFAAFYSPFAVPAAPVSGFGDVYLTLTSY